MSFVVAFVWIPGISNGDFLSFLKIMENISPPLLFMTTSSVLAILRTGGESCSEMSQERVGLLLGINSKNRTSCPANGAGCQVSQSTAPGIKMGLICKIAVTSTKPNVQNRIQDDDIIKNARG